MRLPGKYRIGFSILLIVFALLSLAAGAWVFMSGFEYVVLRAATGAVNDAAHLADLLTMEQAALVFTVVIGVVLLTAFAAALTSHEKLLDNERELVRRLKAVADGHLDPVTDIHPGDELADAAAAVDALVSRLRSRHTFEEAGEAEEMKTRFLEIISHQLRTPLTAVRWNIEALVNGDLGPLKKRQQDMLRITSRNYQGILSMLSDWVEALEVERGLLQLNPEPLVIADLLKSVGTEFRSQARLKRLAFRVSAARDLPRIVADKLKLHYVFSKLLHNAMSYTAEGGRVTLRARMDGRFVRFDVEDSGVGIPPDEQPDIFKKFFRASNAALMQPNASGVGLFVVKTLVEAHGGAISFDSEEGSGTTFTFTVPATPTGSARRRRPV